MIPAAGFSQDGSIWKQFYVVNKELKPGGGDDPVVHGGLHDGRKPPFCLSNGEMKSGKNGETLILRTGLGKWL